MILGKVVHPHLMAQSLFDYVVASALEKIPKVKLQLDCPHHELMMSSP
jgi:hypothetical protein